MDNTCRKELTLHDNFDLRAFFPYGFRAGHEDDIVAAGELREHLCCRPDHSSGAVALHRVADFFAGCDPYTTNSRAVFHNVGYQRRICVHLSAGVHPAEITVGIERYRFRQSDHSPRSGGKLLSAFGSAAGKDLASVGSGHSFAEAVLHFALTLFRLIRSFHSEPLHSLFALKNQRYFSAGFEKGRTPPFISQYRIIY